MSPSEFRGLLYLISGGVALGVVSYFWRVLRKKGNNDLLKALALLFLAITFERIVFGSGILFIEFRNPDLLQAWRDYVFTVAVSFVFVTLVYIFYVIRIKKL